MSDKAKGIFKVCPVGDRIQKIIVGEDGRVFGCFHRGDTYMRCCDACKYKNQKTEKEN